jgi:hypothetical protein
MPRLSPMHATCPAHLILLDFITRTILCVGYRSLNSSLWRYFMHSKVILYFHYWYFVKFHMGVVGWKWILMFNQMQLITNTKTLLNSCTKLM